MLRVNRSRTARVMKSRDRAAASAFPTKVMQPSERLAIMETRGTEGSLPLDDSQLDDFWVRSAMSKRLGPIFLNLRHASDTLRTRFRSADLLILDACEGSKFDESRPPLVVVSDSELLETLVPSQRESLLQAMESGSTSLLTVGQGTGAGDPAPEVTLPLSVSERELVQSSRLLAEIVALRRARQEAADAKSHWQTLALVDPLTALPNRRGWEAELVRRAELKEGFCMGIVDLDFFKRINDRSGHDVGDSVLRETAKIMRAELRKSDFLARLGGDEFGVLLGPVDRHVAIGVLDRLRHTVAIQLQAALLPSTTLSAGCVVISAGNQFDCQEVYAVAAKSLQAAKQADRNQTVARETTAR